MIALKRNDCLKATKSNIQSIIFFRQISREVLLQPGFQSPASLPNSTSL